MSVILAFFTVSMDYGLKINADDDDDDDDISQSKARSVKCYCPDRQTHSSDGSSRL